MRLKELIKSAGLSLSEYVRDFEVKGITSDSRKVRENFIFVAVKGGNFDGHDFIREAVRKGARAIIGSVHSPQSIVHKKVAYIKVSDTRRALAKLTAQFYGQPSLNLKTVGITGTNGKTTVSYLLEAILRCARFSPAVIGTINYRFKHRIFKANNTTPGPEQLQALLARMQKEKVDYVIIEVSSHALDQGRVGAIGFCAAVFTNLAKDHLDYHRDLNSYFAAKSKLFEGLSRNSFAVLNIDDVHTPELIKLTGATVVTYGLSSRAEVSASDLNYSLGGTEFLLCLRGAIRKDFGFKIDRLRLKTSLIGRHNIYNILAAVAFGLTQRIEPEIIREAIKGFSGVPGRLEMIPTGRNFSVFVDYAHTEDALMNVLRSLRPLCKGRLCVVFGAGGARDKTKRPQMGRVASELADIAIITTDNPRNEEPEEIIDDIILGINPALSCSKLRLQCRKGGVNKQNFRVIINRKDAIKEALSLAGKDDIILIAGKGHENSQIFKDRVIHFDDREVVRECLPRPFTKVE